MRSPYEEPQEDCPTVASLAMPPLWILARSIAGTRRPAGVKSLQGSQVVA